MSTNSHVVAAPMAAYLVRNQSRFKYSHEFSFTRLNDFNKEGVCDFQLTSDKQGELFLDSKVRNYLLRPTELDDVSLYDFLCKYNVCKPNQKSLNWIGDHINANKLKVCPLQIERVPMINHCDFIDAMKFEERDLATETVGNEPDAIQSAMEHHARRIATVFLPFRKLDDLKSNGRFLPTIQHGINQCRTLTSLKTNSGRHEQHTDISLSQDCCCGCRC